MKEQIAIVNKNRGIRLDVFLCENLPGFTRKQARFACEQKNVEINGKIVCIPGQRLELNDVVKIKSQSVERVRARPEIVGSREKALENIKIVFEDEYLLVVSKPREMHSITLALSDPVTLADNISAYCEDCLTASWDSREAGLVQRLDFFTSGLVLAAKSREIHKTLLTALKNGEIEKSYLALVEGEFSKKGTTILTPLLQSDGGRKMEIASKNQIQYEKTFPAETGVHFVKELLLADQVCSVVRATASRAKRHQIRVHLSSIGHPLVADELYGAKAELTCALKAELGIDGFLLHAESLAFTHPTSGEKLSFVYRLGIIGQ